MGQVVTEITLANVKDEGKAEDGIISINDVRKVTVQAIVDTGAMTLIITEELYKKLGLTQKEEKIANLADGRKVSCIVTRPVSIYWKNRSTVVEAVVVPGAARVLLGVIPLEDMDLIVEPKKEELVGAHGDEVLAWIY
jgi:clan AA aspartic protease